MSFVKCISYILCDTNVIKHIIPGFSFFTLVCFVMFWKVCYLLFGIRQPLALFHASMLDQYIVEGAIHRQKDHCQTPLTTVGMFGGVLMLVSSAIGVMAVSATPEPATYAACFSRYVAVK